jgi:hypothetical protein
MAVEDAVDDVEEELQQATASPKLTRTVSQESIASHCATLQPKLALVRSPR